MRQIDPESLWEGSQELGDDLVDAGADPDAVAKSVAEFLDDLVPLNLLIPGLPGMALELADGPALQLVIKVLAKALKGDPEKRAERRLRRQSKRDARRAKRGA